MITRREFVQAALAAGMLSAAGGLGNWSRLAARQGLSEEAILEFEPLGNVTLVHISDIHAQLKPVYFREPSVNIGVGKAAGRPPHLTGAAFLEHYHLAAETPGAYALTYEDFVALARSYGRMGGLDRVATVLKSIRAARDGKTLFLDGGDTWQGSYTANRTKGADMIAAITTPDSPRSYQQNAENERVRRLHTTDVAVGDAAPDFDLAVFDFSTGVRAETGQRFHLREVAKNTPVALIFGSYT